LSLRILGNTYFPREQLEDLGIDRKDVKMDLKKEDVKAWPGFIRLRTATSGGILGTP
jgi:hypothetical protein